MTFRYLRVALALAMLMSVLGAGCAPESDSEGEESQESGASGESGWSDTPVLMLGRSVMWGWFKHWGWDGAFESMPFQKDGYSLTFNELQEPPGIADSAMAYMDEAPEGCVVLFKFCFLDFHGGEDFTFEEQKEWVEQVADKAEERGQRLIFGNALPKTKGETDSALVAEHERFNE